MFLSKGICPVCGKSIWPWQKAEARDLDLSGSSKSQIELKDEFGEVAGILTAEVTRMSALFHQTCDGTVAVRIDTEFIE